MVRIKRALALLLMTILIMSSTDVAYAVEIPDDEPALADSAEVSDFDETSDSDVVSDSKEVFDEDIDTRNEDPAEEETDEEVPAAEDEQFFADEESLLEGKLLGGLIPDFNMFDIKMIAPRPAPSPDLDICFYIRGNGIGARIPSEPSISLYTDYSDAIRINGAVNFNKLSFSEKEVDGSLDSLLDDGFTASNDVTSILNKVPTENDIKGVVPDFDPQQHYVVWYVIKESYTVGDNSDVLVHVDGVIRDRQEQKEVEPEPEEEPKEIHYTTGDPDHDKRLEKIESTIKVINIVPQYRDANGVEMKDIEYDGEKHLVGGFDIVVVDTNRNVLAEFMHDMFGNLLYSKVYAEDDRTTFEYKGETFYVNVTSAYMTVVDKIQGDIQFYSGKNKISFDDIVVTDVRGKPLNTDIIASAGPILGPGDSERIDVKKRNLVIEAGSTVRNDNGTTITNDTYKIVEGSLAKGHRIDSVVFNGSQTGVGYSTNEITSLVIVDEKGKDVTKKYYHIEYVPGKLQLVDGSKKSSFGRTSTASTDNNGGITGVTGGAESIANNTNSFGTVYKAKVTHADGSVTYINVPFETSVGLDLSDSQPQVLGARRAGTGDDSPLTRYVMILICAGVIALITLGTRRLR